MTILPGMRQALKLHPDSLCSAVTHIEVDVARPRAGSLVLSYFVTGKIGDLRMPPVVAAARTDELWQHTCFEAFVGSSGERRRITNSTLRPRHNGQHIGSAATEAGCVLRPRSARPGSKCNRSPERYTLQASLELDRLSRLPA